MTQQLLLLELNEINFPYVQAYVERGELPNLGRLIAQHGMAETSSEQKYEELEPWIQWVTGHTGLKLAQHGIFRLGDTVKHDIPQIWEQLEESGLKVGAISPMNAKNRTRNAAFFVPDPWTPTDLTAGFLLRKLYDAVAQAVNDNAQSKLTVGSLMWLLAGAARYARLQNYGQYLRLALSARKKPWSKAMFLDLLLADVFIVETKRTEPNFASLFLNAGAHIQHHYMFNAAVYQGAQKNPAWYLSANHDPVLDVYRLYDRIVAQVMSIFPEARIMIATGLHQDPHPEVTYYWRLKDHARFLRTVGASFESVEPRMSRDFIIRCANADDAARTEDILARAVSQDEAPLFEVDNRGQDLFVMLTYPHNISDDFVYQVGNVAYKGLKQDVVFVAIKNGQHNGIGYFIDTGTASSESVPAFPLAELPQKITQALGVAS